MEKIKPKNPKKDFKLGIVIILGSIVGCLSLNMQLWFVLSIAIGAALGYGTQKNYNTIYSSCNKSLALNLV